MNSPTLGEMQHSSMLFDGAAGAHVRPTAAPGFDARLRPQMDEHVVERGVRAELCAQIHGRARGDDAAAV
jgi:hypothetical protein